MPSPVESNSFLTSMDTRVLIEGWNGLGRTDQTWRPQGSNFYASEENCVKPSLTPHFTVTKKRRM